MKLKNNLLAALFMVVMTPLSAVQAESLSNKLSATQLGTQLESALRASDAATAATLFDFEQIGRSAALELFDDEKQIREFVQGMLQNGKESLVSNMFSLHGNDVCKIDYLRNMEWEEKTRPLVRVNCAETGTEYAVFYQSAEDGRVTDVYFASRGKTVTQNIANMARLMMVDNPNVIKRFLGVKDVDMELIKSLTEAMTSYRQGQFSDAYTKISSLPKAVQDQRVIIDLAIMISARVDENLYRNELERLAKLYGDDPTTTFILVDHYFYQGDFDKADNSITAMMDTFGEDAALLNLRASIAFQAGQYPKAIGYAHQAIAQEEDFEDAYWTLTTINTTAERYDAVVDSLLDLENKFGYQFSAEELRQAEFYAGFVQSSEFAKWAETH